MSPAGGGARAGFSLRSLYRWAGRCAVRSSLYAAFYGDGCAMSSQCPRCLSPVYYAEKVSSLGKNWHRFCLKCELCNKVLSAGGHAEHDGRPYCHKPCYAVLFGPKGVNIGGVGSYIYDTTPRAPERPPPPISPARSNLSKPPSRVVTPTRTFAGEKSLCPGCREPVYFAEKVMSLGRNWHRPCLRCQRCNKTLTAGGHAEHDGLPYCHVPCYGHLFGPKGVNIGDVGCYLYDPLVENEKPDEK